MSGQEVQEFFEWLINIGCPIHVIPTENKIKDALRVQILPVEDMKARFRPAEEAWKIREEHLRVDLCKIKRGNFLIADRRAVSWEYLQYVKLSNTKKEIKRLESAIDDLKKDYDRKSQKLSEKNAFKRQQKKTIEKNAAKMRVFDMNNMILSEKIEEAKEILSKCDSAMYPIGKENDCHGRTSLETLKELLVKFYDKSGAAKSNSEISDRQEDTVTALWTEISEVLKKTPNSAICREIFTDLMALLESTNSLLQKNVNLPNEEKDPLYEHTIGLKDFLANRIKLLIYLKHYKDKLNSIKEAYVDKYAAFQDMLEIKMGHYSHHFIDEYVQALIVGTVFRGQIALLKSEAEKFKTSVHETPEDLRCITKDVKTCHENFLTEAKKAEGNMFQLSQVTPKLQYTLRLLQLQLNGLKRQIANEEILDYTLSPSRMSHTEITIDSSPTVIEDVSEEKQDPVLKQITPQQEDFDFPLPCSQDDCNKLEQYVLDAEASLQDILMQIETVGLQTEKMLNDAKVHCNFLIDNPMKKFVPPTKKFKGHTYQDYETEFEFQYRQISD